MNRVVQAGLAAVVLVAGIVGVLAEGSVALIACVVTAAIAGGALAAMAVRPPPRATTGATLPVLHEVSNRLFDAHGVQELGAAVREVAKQIGATDARLVLRAESELVAVPRDLDGEPIDGSGTADLRPLELVADRGSPILWSTSTRGGTGAPPDWVPSSGSGGAAAVAALPIDPEQGGTGLLLLRYEEPQPFDATQRLFLTQVAGQVERAVEKALVEEANRSVATELQQSLLGPTVLVPQVGHCSRYLPADAGLFVGGDWYQTIRLGDGNFGIAVGDALGHGLGAAAVMGQLRSALAACALRADSAADALDTLDEYARSLPGAAATTVVYAVVDVLNGWLEYSSAGHPYPLYVSPSGDVEFLDRAQGVPLCSEDVAQARPSVRIPFCAGSTVVMYTDGLVERRREPLGVGFGRLADAVRADWRLPIELLADRIMGELLEDTMRVDDVAVLVLRSPVSSPDLFLTKVPAQPAELAPLRRNLRTWLVPHLRDTREVNAVLTAVGEACANAIDHAYRAERVPLMRVEGARLDDELVLNVTDTGRWRTPTVQPERGRGIVMMRGLADEMVIDRRRSGTSVTLRYCVGGVRSARSL